MVDAVEGLGTTVLAAVTAVTAETLLVESDCITGEEQQKKQTKNKTNKKNTTKKRKKNQTSYTLTNKHVQKQDSVCSTKFRDEFPCYIFFYL